MITSIEMNRNCTWTWSTVGAIYLVILLVISSFVQYAGGVCVPRHKTYGKIGDTVTFTLCLVGPSSSDFMLLEIDGKKDFIPINQVWKQNFWKWNWADERRIEAHIEMEVYQDIFDSDIKLGFAGEDKTLKYFDVWVERVDIPQAETTESPPSKGENSLIPVVIAVVVALVILLAIGLLVYKKRGQLLTAARDKTDREQPHLKQANDAYEVEETILSNPVYGMPKQLVGQESSERHVYHDIS